MGLFKEFKAFAMRGNVVDMAVGIIIGAAFGKVVSSLVNDVVMPPIGKLLGGVDFADMKLRLSDAVVDAAGTVTTPAVDIKYGLFINTVLDFLIVAFVIFMIIKAMNSLKRKQDEAAKVPPSPPEPSTEAKLLTEIRDLMRERA